MGGARQPQKTKLFSAIMFRPEVDLDKILKTLSRDYGPVEDAYGPIAFNFSNYYEEEMGCGLLKTYISFSRPFDREVLPHIKKSTNDLESAYSNNGKRAINVDPGYIAKDKLVLASTKDFYHRLYLGNGIYGEVTLHFRKGKYRYFSWTYPDYMDPEFLAFLTKVRAKMVKELRDDEHVSQDKLVK
jgi:Domain of unknown function (DUF4416)